ncbi:hypothetical protein [Pseudoalteromonas sp. OF7H-1]|uniref:hypothetical protein n=1 Tax=Pseudoalteromonas sp. OF7H-1 TaxID=2917755 RepID=UPI001EF63E3B|nr:hypothetical protein [Pseudoalteromonas sp. OF7H-1]MCG7539211.1 hypothetical protein [Pseudoalteromonas sp. OF7H-1]
MINFLIGVIRFPLTLFFSSIYLVAVVVGLVVESVSVILAFLFLAIFAGKKYIKSTWLAEYPHSTRNFFSILRDILRWGLLLKKEESVSCSGNEGLSQPAEGKSKGSTGGGNLFLTFTSIFVAVLIAFLERDSKRKPGIQTFFLVAGPIEALAIYLFVYGNNSMFNTFLPFIIPFLVVQYKVGNLGLKNSQSNQENDVSK